MPKNELVKGIRLPPVGGSTATFSGGRIIPGSLPVSAFSCTELSAITANLGTVTAGTLNLYGPDASYLKISNAPYLALEMAIPDGRLFWRAKADDDPCFFLGLPKIGDTTQPLRVDADGDLAIDGKAIVTNLLATNLLVKGRLELTPSGAAYETANNGILITATPDDDGVYGIRSKRAGVQTVLWDAANGWFRVGGTSHYWLGTSEGLHMYTTATLHAPLSFIVIDGAVESEYSRFYMYSGADASESRWQSLPRHTAQGTEVYPHFISMEAIGSYAAARAAITVRAESATAGNIALEADSVDTIATNIGLTGETRIVGSLRPTFLHMDDDALHPLDMHHFFPRRFSIIPTHELLEEGELALAEISAADVFLLYRPTGSTNIIQWEGLLT